MMDGTPLSTSPIFGEESVVKCACCDLPAYQPCSLDIPLCEKHLDLVIVIKTMTNLMISVEVKNIHWFLNYYGFFDENSPRKVSFTSSELFPLLTQLASYGFKYQIEEEM